MLSQLRVFLVALEEGSLNRAATRLRMSQSALSRQMQALEEETVTVREERVGVGQGAVVREIAALKPLSGLAR